MGYSLRLETDPPELPPGDQVRAVSLITATVLDGRGRPAAGEPIHFTQNPQDLGRLAPLDTVTDAQGRALSRFEGPLESELRGRDRVQIGATDRSRNLNAIETIRIGGYTLLLEATPQEATIANDPDAVLVKATLYDPRHNPVAKDPLNFDLSPPGLGRLTDLVQSTDAKGEAFVRYYPPSPSELRNFDHATVRVLSIRYQVDGEIEIPFKGLRVTGTEPKQDAKDIDWETLKTIRINFNAPLDPASISTSAVKVDTISHGDLGAKLRVENGALVIDLSQPVPDVGLRVRVDLAAGKDGLKSADGMPLISPYALQFKTLPRLKPRLVVSQVVDDPHERFWPEVRSVAMKPFAIRVEAGLSDETELDEEVVDVKLFGPYEETVQSEEHTYYPGRWPPEVPASALKHGNAALFVVRQVDHAGRYSFRAELHPKHAAEDRLFSAFIDDVNVNRFAAEYNKNGSTLRVAILPISNEQVPFVDWVRSRNQAGAWAHGFNQSLLPMLPSLAIHTHLADNTTIDCKNYGGAGAFCLENSPWTYFAGWTRQGGRAGMLTAFRYFLLMVPPGFFKQFADHPDVIAHPQYYHHAMESGLWSYRSFPIDGGAPYNASSTSIIEAGASDTAVLHAFGEAEGFGHSGGSIDPLAGYDLVADEVIATDATHATGAAVSIMNDAFWNSKAWWTVPDYEALLHAYTERSCLTPPCPAVYPRADSEAGATGPGSTVPKSIRPESLGPEIDHSAAPRHGSPAQPTQAPAPTPQALVGVSGYLREPSDGAPVAVLDPLIMADGYASSPLTDPKSGYAVEVRDAAGTTLARYAFQPPFGPVPGARLASFVFALPRPANLGGVQVTKGAVVLAERRRSANPPSVRFIQPPIGASAKGLLDLAWLGSDPDGDRLTYQLLFRGDAESLWLPLKVDQADPRAGVDTERLANGPAAQFQVIASDGFDSASAILDVGLTNPLTILGNAPLAGARQVPLRSTISISLRDPLDPNTVAGAFRVRTAGNAFIRGSTTYNRESSTFTFTPSRDLPAGTELEARLSRRVATADGRRLDDDFAWRFRTRGPVIYLPRLLASGISGSGRQPTATSWPTALPDVPGTSDADPTATPGSPVNPRPGGGGGPAPSRTPMDGHPTPTAPSGSPTPTSVASPTPASPSSTPSVASPSPSSPSTTPQGGTATVPPLTSTPVGPSPTPLTSGVPLTMDGIAVTGEDPTLARMAFARGENIKLWLRIANPNTGPVRATVSYGVVGRAGYAPNELMWSGELDIPAGSNWLSLERTVPGAPTAPYTFSGTVYFGGGDSSMSSQLYLAGSLALADDFSTTTNNWGVGSDAGSAVGYFEGVLRFQIFRPDVWRWSAPTTGPSLVRMALEADLRMPNTVQGAGALLFGLNATNDGFYLFEVFKNGRYAMYRRVGGQWQELVAPTSSAALLTDDRTNHLMVVNDNGNVTLYANGNELATRSGNVASSGRAALYASGAASGHEARFDNARVYSLALP